MELILAFSIIAGQLAKLPVNGLAGPVLLDLTITAFVILAAFKSIFARKGLAGLTTAFKFALIFALLGLISNILTPLNLNLSEKITSLSYLLRFFIYILFSWILISGFFPALVKKTASIMWLSGITLAGIGLAQFVFLPDLRLLIKQGWDPHYFRAVSTFLDPNFFGAALVLTLIFFITQVSNAKSSKVSFTLVFAALLLTFSRGAYLAFAASFLFLAVVQRSARLLMLTLLLSAMLLSGFVIYQRIVAQPHEINRTESAKNRISSWQQGLAVFAKNPLLGVGFNNYRFALRDYGLADNELLSSRGSSSNDSSLLYVAATTGVLGLASYSAFLISLFLSSLRAGQRGNPWGITLTASLVALISQSFFANTLFYPFLLIWILLLVPQLFNTSR